MREMRMDGATMGGGGAASGIRRGGGKKKWEKEIETHSHELEVVTYQTLPIASPSSLSLALTLPPGPLYYTALTSSSLGYNMCPLVDSAFRLVLRGGRKKGGMNWGSGHVRQSSLTHRKARRESWLSGRARMNQVVLCDGISRLLSDYSALGKGEVVSKRYQLLPRRARNAVAGCGWARDKRAFQVFIRQET